MGKPLDDVNNSRNAYVLPNFPTQFVQERFGSRGIGTWPALAYPTSSVPQIHKRLNKLQCIIELNLM